MTTIMLILCLQTTIPAAPAAGPRPVAVTLLSDAVLTGKMIALHADRLELRGAQGSRVESIPLAEVLRIDFVSAGAPTDSLVDVGARRVLLRDGSRLTCASYLAQGRSTAIRLSDGRELRMPIDKVAAVLFASLDATDFETWRDRERRSRMIDILVVERDGKRYDLGGIVGRVDERNIEFALDGDELPVPLEKVHSILYAGQPSEPKAEAVVRDSAGNLWSAKRIEWHSRDAPVLRTVGGLEPSFVDTELVTIDFAPGRLVHLSELTPTAVRHTPFFDVPWEPRRDANFEGAPLRVAGKTYARGLCVHSKTALEFDLAGTFRSFRTFLGIDEAAGDYGDAIVRISCDGRSLFEARVRAHEPARSISLALEGAKTLLLEVEYGATLDLGDHIVFGAAKLIK